MCGIFGYIGTNKKSAKLVLEGLKILEYRGYDSWGIAVVKSQESGKKIVVKKKAGKIGDAKADDLPDSFIGLGHTRWATHGGVTDKNAHPHLDCTKTIAIVHNGIIENYLEIKKDLMEKGHKFISDTDTEVAAHLIEEYYKGRTFIDAVRKAFLAFKGRNAIIALSAHEHSFTVVKNGSPIVLGVGSGENFIASDASALLPLTRNVIFLDDNCAASITDQKIDLYSVGEGTPLTKSIVRLDWKVEDAQKAPYPHFLLKEIMEQGQTIKNTVTQDKNGIFRFADSIRNSYGSFFVGCGSAAHACREATYIFSVISKRHINFCVGSEFAYFKDYLKTGSLLIAVSQSGETADILEAVSAARKQGSKINSIVNVTGSTLARVSNNFLPLRVGPEKSVLSTKAFTGKIALFYLLAYTLEDRYQEGLKMLIQAADVIHRLLKNDDFHVEIKKIVNRIYRKDDIYIIGRGLSYPIALEAAHKIKEASYIHAEGFAGGEPKHCEISLISKGTPCVIYAPLDETRDAILSNAMEFKARGGLIIGISPKSESVFDYWIKIPDLGIMSSVANIIPAQLMAYHLAIKRGCDPDKPRNLAKSVTVK